MKSHILALGLLFAVGITLNSTSAQEKLIRQAALTGETAMIVRIEGGMGSLHVRRGASNTAFSLVQLSGESDDARPSVRYNIKDDKGVLTVELNVNENEDGDGLAELLHLFKGKHGGTWRLELTDRVPIDFRMEFGAGEAALDLTGLVLAGLRLETGASSLRIRSAEPNTARIGTVSITAGLGSIESESLGNLNFDRMRFEGGLGSYELDLSGALRDGAQIRAEVGLGSLDILVPAQVGILAYCEDNFLSSSDLHRFVRLEDDVYASPNYKQSSRKVKMNLESGLGSVSVRVKK